MPEGILAVAGFDMSVILCKIYVLVTTNGQVETSNSQ